MLKMPSRKCSAIVGDFNFPFIDWNSMQISRLSRCQSDFLDFCLLNSLVLCVSEPTRDDALLNLAFLSDAELLVLVQVTESFATLPNCALPWDASQT